MIDPTDPTDLPVDVLRTIDLLPEPFNDRFGREYMDEVDARSLALRLNILLIPVDEMEDPGHLQVILGRPTLFYRSSLWSDALTHLMLDCVARHLGASDIAAQAFAYVGRIGADGHRLGATWISARWRSLRDLGHEWHAAMMEGLPTMLDAVLAVIADLQGLQPSSSETPVLDWSAAKAVFQARVARRRGDLGRAEAWAEYALARGGADVQAGADALNCLARCDYQRGRVGAAKARWLELVLYAQQHGLLFVQGAAHVNLVAAAMIAHDEECIQRHGKIALRCLPQGHPELDRLAQNYARYRLDFGCYAAALPVLTSLANAPGLSNSMRTCIYAGLTRCFAGMGDREGFDASWCATLTVLELSEDWAPDAYHELAQAAVVLGEWECAERTARKALHLAEERRDGRAVIDAEALLMRIEQRNGAFTDGVLEPVPWLPDGDLSRALAAAVAVS